MTVHYFAWVRERMGRDNEVIDPPPGIDNIADLIAWLGARDAAGAAAFGDPAAIRAAIDAVMVPPHAPIGHATDVSLFPPVTGG